MNNFKRTLIERETIILFNEAEKTATIETSNKALSKKLLKCCEEYPEMFSLLRTSEYLNNDKNMLFELPKKYIKITKPRKVNTNHKEMAARFKANSQSTVETT